MLCVRPTSWWEKRQMGESGLCEVEGMSGFLDVGSVFEGTPDLKSCMSAWSGIA